MCGRFTNKDPQAIYEEYKIDIRANYNVTPSSSVLTITDKPEMMLWAYNPTWTKKPFNLINARSETLNEKPSFRMAKRCLIIADGWYEWLREEKNKQPYYFHFDHKVISFAGIYTQYNGTNGCAIVTKEAEESIKHIHHRMPVILDKNDESAWLAGKDHIASNASMNIKFHPVSKMVNSPSNNSGNCIKELSA